VDHGPYCEFADGLTSRGVQCIGAGEDPMASPHVSILNAIRDACGVRVTSLPAKPEKVLAAILANAN
jgi:CO/xanthine dehydrogenase Mo-binding subunit